MSATVADVVGGSERWCVESGEALTLLRAVPDSSIGAVITDPPYSSGGLMRGDRNGDPKSKYTKSERLWTFSGDNRDQRSFEYWCVLWLSEARRATIPGGVVVQFCDWRQLPVTTDALQSAGWVWRGIFVWSKGNACRPQMGRFRSACEFAVWGTNGPSLDLESVGCLPGVVECPPVSNNEREHITQKPEKVMESVCAIAPPGSVILDPFCGSGSTGVAAARIGRRFIGFDLSSEYVTAARERLTAEVAGLRVFDHRNGQLGLLSTVAP